MGGVENENREDSNDATGRGHFAELPSWRVEQREQWSPAPGGWEARWEEPKTERQTDRQTGRQAGRQTDSQREIRHRNQPGSKCGCAIDPL